VASYRQYFSYLAMLDSKARISTRPTGQRESPGAGWDYAPPTRCARCTAHAKNGGGHDSVGRHWCTDRSPWTPIDPRLRLPIRFVREAQNFLSYQRWLVQGWTAADPDYKVNADAGNNFCTWFIYEIVGASGRTLTLRVGAVEADPRACTVTFMQLRDPETGQLRPTFIQGSWCQVGDQLDIGGNSVLTGRVSCRIVANDGFTGLGTPVGTGQTFSVTVDQDVSFAALKARPEDAANAPVAVVYREAYQPEAWYATSEADPMFVVYRSWETSAAPYLADGIVPLADGEGYPARIAWPLEGVTFRLEIDYGAGYQAVSLRGEPMPGGGDYTWPRIVDRGGGTRLYLGSSGARGESWPNLLAGAKRLRIYYGCHVWSSDVEGASSPCQGHCLFCAEDYNKVVPRSGANGTGWAVGPDGEDHAYVCLMRDRLGRDVLSQFEPGHCWLMGWCPYFRPAPALGITQYHWSQLFCEQDTALVQLVAGVSDTNNFQLVRRMSPSFAWLLDRAEAFASPAGNWPLVAPFCGGLGEFQLDTDQASNQLLRWACGAVVNWSLAGRGELYFPELPTSELIWEDARGVLARRVPSNLRTRSQLSGTPWSEAGHLETQLAWWVGMNMLCGVRKDPVGYGSSTLDTGVRGGAAGIEGQGRRQRFNRSTRADIPDVDLARTGTPQHDPGTHHAVVYSSPQLIRNQAWRVLLQLRADGAADYGAKRLGGGSAKIAKLEELGGLLKVELELGDYTLSQSGANQGAPGEDLLVHFTGGGNAVSLHPFYRVGGYYGNADQTGFYPPFAKAIAGDTLRVGDADLWIVGADPCAGSAVPGEVPESGDLPGVGDLAYLKNRDVLWVRDENGILAGSARPLVGQDVSVHTSGVIQDQAAVRVYWCEYGRNTWNAVPASEMLIYRAMGRIWLSESFCKTLPARVCFQILAPIANRTEETPAEVAELVISCMEACDEVLVGAPLAPGGAYTMEADIVLGSGSFTEYEPGQWKPTGSIVSGLHYAAINQVAQPPVSLILETKPSPGKYGDVVAGEGLFRLTSGMAPGRVSVGCISHAELVDRGRVWLTGTLYQLRLEQFLKRLPTDAQIISALIEVTMPAGGLITHSLRHYVMTSLGGDWGIVRDAKNSAKDKFWSEDSMNCAFSFVGERNDGTWEFLGSYLDLGAALKAGQQRVVPCLGFVQALQRSLKNSQYRQICLWVAPNEMPKWVPPAGQLKSNPQKTILNMVRATYETIEQEGWSGNPAVRYGTDTPTAEQVDRMWHNRFALHTSQLDGGQFIFGRLGIQYQLPAEAIQTRMAQGNLPTLIRR
jgi:hypothetical protein